MITLQCKFSVLELILSYIVCYSTVFSVDTKNGCVEDKVIQGQQQQSCIVDSTLFFELGNRLMIGEVRKLSEIKHDKKN